jgi:CheY-like chemotaxis protein
VHGIVKRNNGDIAVASEAGRGTTFSVFLPAAIDQRVAVPVSLAARAASPQGSETVLVVEDDPGVLELARVALERNGYCVLEAGAPSVALRIAATYAKPIHLLLSDVVMPELQGPPLVDRLRVSQPRLRVLYMSGYADDTVLHQGVLAEGTPFLQKPFTLHALTVKVREVLDATTTS